MAMGRQRDRQGELMASWSELPLSPGHVFYDRLQSVLVEGGFRRQGLDDRRRVALIGRVQLGCHHRAGVEVDRVLGFVSEVRGAVLHLGDPRIRVGLGDPVRAPGPSPLWLPRRLPCLTPPCEAAQN